MRKIPFAGIELTSQCVRGLRGTSGLPGQPAIYIIYGVYIVLCRRLRHVVCREGLLSSTSDSIVNLANGGFACDTSLPHYWRMLVIFCVSPCDSISSSGSVIGNRASCAGSVAGQHCCNGAFVLIMWYASPSCVCFISFGFLLATICVWVWMVCSLHSVTSREIGLMCR